MSAEGVLRTFGNGESVLTHDVPEVGLDTFLQGIVDLTGLGWRIAAYFGVSAFVLTLRLLISSAQAINVPK